MKLSKFATRAAAIAVTIATSGAAFAKDAPSGDIASKIMSNPQYISAAKNYAMRHGKLRHGYQAEASVPALSTFLPIAVVAAVATTAVAVGTKGSSASPQ